MSNIRNLVFSGVSLDARNFVDIAKELEKNLGGSFEQIERIAATASGAIIALMLALNYSAAEIEKQYQTINFIKIADCQNFLNEAEKPVAINSIYDSDFLRRDIINLLHKKNYPANMSFADLAKNNCKNLYIVTTKIYSLDNKAHTEPHIFSAQATPDTSVMLAVLASASIRGLFSSIYLQTDARKPGLLVENKNGCAHADDNCFLKQAGGNFFKMVPRISGNQALDSSPLHKQHARSKAFIAHKVGPEDKSKCLIM